MRRFGALTLLQFRALLATAGGNRRRARLWPSAVSYALVAVLVLVMSSSYSFALIAALGPAHADLVLLLMPAAGGLFAVLVGSQGADAVVFGGRDNDLLLSLPIPRTMLAGAKVAALLAENVVLMVCVLLPAGFAYVSAVTPGWPFWVALPAVAVLLGAGLTAVSLVVGLGLTLLRSRRRARFLVNTVAMLALVGFMAVWIAAQNALGDLLLRDPDRLRTTLAAWLPPFGWAHEALLTGAPAAWLLLAVSMLVPLVALAWVIGRAFVGLVSALKSRGGPARAANLAGLRTRTPFAALVRREAQRFFGTTVFFLNTGFGLVVAALGAGYLLVTGGLPGLDAVARAMSASEAHLLALALGLVLTTVQTTSPSISLEGHRLWILKSAPVRAATVLDAKAAFNVLLAAPVIALGAVAVIVTTTPTPLEALGVVLVPVGVAALGAVVGLVANLRWPNLDAPNETVAVKQGLAVVVALFGSMIVTVGAAAVGLQVTQSAGSGAGLTATWVALLAAAGAGYALLRTWGLRAFARLD